MRCIKDDPREAAWFGHWTPTVEGLLAPYQEIVASLGLRPAEIQERVEYVLCTHILGQAIRRNREAWTTATGLTGPSFSLRNALVRLFGNETPPSVAALVMETLVDDSEEYDEGLGIRMGRELLGHATEREQLGPPLFVWVVRIVGGGRMTVSVENRAKLKDETVGLIRVVDAR